MNTDESAHSPTEQRNVFSRLINGAVSPVDGVVVAFLVRVFQLLDLKIISHERVGHHPVDQKHEGGAGAVHERTPTPDHHHGSVLVGGKPELCDTKGS